MGFIRLYLAFSVLASHSNSLLPWQMHSGVQAVQLFFIISGFYMAMVLSQGYSSTKSFYLSRFLRIYFPYCLALLFVIALSLSSKLLFNDWLQLTPYLNHPLSKNGLQGLLFTGFSNVSIFLQDTVMFATHDQGASFALTPKFSMSKSPLWQYLLLPQCWSVSLELMFYLVAPRLNRYSTKNLAFLVVITFLARIAFYRITEYQDDPWNYRFFPFELAFFLVGMLGWRVYDKYKIAARLPLCQNTWAYISCCALILGAFYAHVQLGNWIEARVGTPFYVLYYLSFALPVALTFAVFRKNAIDRFIGELSFPIYLTHIVIIKLVTVMLKTYHWPESVRGPLAGVITLAVSLVFFVFAIKPFEAWRHQVVARRRERQVAAPVPATFASVAQ